MSNKNLKSIDNHIKFSLSIYNELYDQKKNEIEEINDMIKEIVDITIKFSKEIYKTNFIKNFFNHLNSKEFTVVSSEAFFILDINSHKQTRITKRINGFIKLNTHCLIYVK